MKCHYALALAKRGLCFNEAAEENYKQALKHATEDAECSVSTMLYKARLCVLMNSDEELKLLQKRLDGFELT
jgi:hypothetical protein